MNGLRVWRLDWLGTLDGFAGCLNSGLLGWLNVRTFQRGRRRKRTGLTLLCLCFCHVAGGGGGWRPPGPSDHGPALLHVVHPRTQQQQRCGHTLSNPCPQSHNARHIGIFRSSRGGASTLGYHTHPPIHFLSFQCPRLFPFTCVLVEPLHLFRPFSPPFPQRPFSK